MCDILIREKLTKIETPKFVYKRVQKVSNGKYVTPVMGEPLYKGSWKGAKSYDRVNDNALIISLKTKFTKRYWACSSLWAEHHVSRWATFKTLRDARNADLASNFVSVGGDVFPTIIVKCETRGDISEGSYEGCKTYLASQIRVVEEIAETV